ncbi:MAG: CsgG/HfaB family protein [Candidatus Desulfatibia sp.]|uniref:CsgG/HfaB family protein n=1 Tax=Candidatus Desulfatibia sp. TaxID=3101189 RepID=UPI002F327929
MLTTDLAKIKSLRVVERAKIAEIIEEMKLGQAGMLANDSAVLVGKIVGARNIVLGSYIF